MEMDNAANVENVEKDGMRVMEVDSEVELDDDERPVSRMCQSIDFGKTWELATKPVSYTHLDVYKRQVFHISS